jgi:O-antigen/teichoic acid export membrane protein
MSLAIAFLAYLNVLDFGINDSLLRYFVGHRSEHAATQGFLSRMLTLYFMIGILILCLGFLTSEFFHIFFESAISSDQINELKDMIKVMAVGAAIFIGFNPVAALAYAHERHFFMQLLEMAVLVGTTIVMVFLLLQGYGAFSLVAVMAFGKIFKVLVRVSYVRFNMGMRVRLEALRREELKKVILYAAPIFVSVIAGELFWRLDNILIGATLGVAPIAVYAIGVTFNKYFMSFATALSRVMTPEIIRQIDYDVDVRTLTNMMIRISRIQAMFLLLILSGLIVFGQRFILLWLGPDFTQSYWVMLAVLVPYTFELTGNARNIILQVKGLYWQKTAITFLMAVLNIPLTLFLMQVLGVLGAAISTGFAVMIGYVLIAFLLKIKVGMQMWRYWVETSRGIVPVAALLTVLGLGTEYLLPGGWVPLVGGASIYGLVFCLMIYCFATNQQERAFIARGLHRFRSRGPNV